MANEFATASGWQNALGQAMAKGQTEGETVSLSSLSELTGFPVEFIKSELLMKSDEVSMNDLRSRMVSYLENTHSELKN